MMTRIRCSAFGRQASIPEPLFLQPKYRASYITSKRLFLEEEIVIRFITNISFMKPSQHRGKYSQIPISQSFSLIF
jgi:hypothetical protein